MLMLFLWVLDVLILFFSHGRYLFFLNIVLDVKANSSLQVRDIINTIIFSLLIIRSLKGKFL